MSLHALLGDQHKFTVTFDALYWDHRYVEKGSLAYILNFQKACSKVLKESSKPQYLRSAHFPRR